MSLSAPTVVQPELPPPETSSDTNVRFSPDETTVIFVLGGPGSGKGTQSEKLVHNYGFNHLSAGDLLRAEQVREGSQYGELIQHHIREGTIVPMEVTVALLSNAMADALSQGRFKTKPARFLIDGFPRKLDQAVFFEETVCSSRLTLFLNCPEDVLLSRLLKRGETSGRDDDNIESIRKRFRVFEETSMPVVHMFEKQNKVVRIEATGTVEEVYGRIREAVESKGIAPL
jgi:UMP-CMP kinase